jgi:undecaprenyl-diphosphatase
MNDYLLAIILGVVEGLTEFLPVSSTAHIRLTLALLGSEGVLESGYWKMFSVVIQLGAILAVVIYFWRRLLKFVKTFPRGESGDRTLLNHPVTLVFIAFFVTAIPSYLLSKAIKQNLESLWVMGGALLVGGVVMWVVDVWAEKRQQRALQALPPRPGADAAGDPAVLDYESAANTDRLGEVATDKVERMSLWQAVVIGAVQILSAVFPGTSRSMATIAGGQLVGLTRPAALEFSFFLSIPIMFAACLFDMRESIGAPPGDPAYIEGGMTTHRWIVLAIGFVVSFFVAWAVIAWFMGWVRKRGFVPFAIYRIAIGVVVLIWAARSAG